MTDSIKLTVSPSNGRAQRLVIARHGKVSHRSNFNCDSEVSRDRFIRKTAKKFDVSIEKVAYLEDELVRMADAADAQADAAAEELVNKTANKTDNCTKKDSQSTQLVNLAKGTELFHDPDGSPFARITIDDHREVWPLRSRVFRCWLSHKYFLENSRTPGSQALQDAISVLEGRALYESEKFQTYVRLAKHEGYIFVDLCNDRWQAVELNADGWRVIKEPPAVFRRSKAMLPLPKPNHLGDINLLRKYINVSVESWPLIVGWLVAALRPTGPYPVLALFAEQGSGKSTIARLLRSVIDPNTAPIRSEPRDQRDLAISASNSWIVALDNLSNLSSTLSDGLCRLATGGGLATRTLYANDEESIFNAQRPAIINGIEEVISRPDLLDRALIIDCPRIQDVHRKSESELWAAFEDDRPKILGGLLDAVSMAIRKLPTMKFSPLPRMADFAQWVIASEEALPWSAGTFATAYADNRESSNELALESTCVAKAVIGFVTERWEGTATDLLAALNESVDEQTKKLPSWPKSPPKLGGDLRRLAPNLRAVGISIEFSKEAGGKRRRLISILRCDRQS
jgi:polyhydroxyalkanoate synthesis regulator phasin